MPRADCEWRIEPDGPGAGCGEQHLIRGQVIEMPAAASVPVQHPTVKKMISATVGVKGCLLIGLASMPMTSSFVRLRANRVEGRFSRTNQREHNPESAQLGSKPTPVFQGLQYRHFLFQRSVRRWSALRT
jgi:hypothetical protein